MAPRTGYFRTQSESSDFFNELVIIGEGLPLIVKEAGLPIETQALAAFDPAVNLGSALSLVSNGSPQPPATVEIWVDNGDGLIGGGDTLFGGSSQLLTDTTWQQLVDASGDGTKPIILAVDDDGIDDGDYNDIVVDVTISQPEEVCEVSEVTFSFKSESSDFSNIFVINPGEGEQSIVEDDEDTEVVAFDRNDMSTGNFLLATGANPDDARVQIWVDDGDKVFEPGTGDTEYESYIPVSDLTWKLLADASEEGAKDLFLAFDDDGADLDGDFNDMVILADFTAPDCKPDEECTISEGRFTFVDEDSGYDNILKFEGSEEVVQEADGSSALVSFDPLSSEGESFFLETGHDSSLARVKIFVDGGDGVFGGDDSSYFTDPDYILVSDLSWADIVGASGNGANKIFLAFDDDGANLDQDFNDIVVEFVATPCETNCEYDTPTKWLSEDLWAA
jgi:hypothetical protein